MPIGGDLRFSYVLVFAVAAVAVITFEVRRRWRRSVARQEEVKRLMWMVAQEEEARRADFESSLHVAAPYWSSEPDSRPIRSDSRPVESGSRPIDSGSRPVELDSGPVQFECALCFSRATTRCARCKAVRYCSGKCQILHWREGHKNECHPFAIHQHVDVGGGPSQKVLSQQEKCEVHLDSYESKGSPSAKTVQKPKLNSYTGNICGDKDNDAECFADGARTSCSSDDTDKQNDHIACSVDPNQTKPNRTNHDGTAELSISEPYIPYSGFWERSINSNLSKVDPNDKLDCKFDPSIGVKGSDAVAVGRSSISTNAPKGGGMKPLRPPKANQVINRTKATVDPLISKEEILSNTERHSFNYTKPSKDGNVHSTDSSEVASYLTNSKNGFKTSMRKVVDQLRVSKSAHQSMAGSEITGRNIEKGLFPYEKFVKLYNWKKVELLKPRGMLNCGNSCYANVVLQCLAYTPPLTAYLHQGLHSKECKWKGWCFTCEFQGLILKANDGSSPLSPVAILSQIHKIKSHFGNGKEEDAHEFLRYVVDTMQLACLKEAEVNASGSLEEETTLVGLTFGGYLRSKIKCMKCGVKSEQHERLMDLSVEIDGDVGTVEEALRRFTSTEILDGENKYQCIRCRSYQRAKKKFRVLEAPNVLTIALKRFQSDKFEKINKWIRFPEILDLAPFMSATSDKSPIYRLYGVIVHLDSRNAAYSGHYVCYVKNAENKWFEIDDSRVMAVDLESVLANQAYMLLYARCSPRAPRLIKNLMTRDPRKIRSLPNQTRSHSIGPSTNVPTNDPVHNHHSESIYPNNRVFEEDSFSENASSVFSEECSCSTDSTNRDYSSTDDYFGSFFGNYGNDQIYSWRNSSDSESSSASRSPIYSKSKSSVQILDSNSSKHCSKLDSSSSSNCKAARSNRLGWANPFGNKKSGLLFRRSVRERTN